VAEDHGTPGAEVVDVAIAVGIFKECAFGALDKGRIAADGAKGADGRVDSAGKEALGASLQRVRFGALHEAMINGGNKWRRARFAVRQRKRTLTMKPKKGDVPKKEIGQLPSEIGWLPEDDRSR
jgi:hypothetical protein